MDKMLSQVTPEDIEHARRVIEDELIWMRDEHVFIAREVWVGNGLVIREKDGTPSDFIRLRVGEAIQMAIQAIVRQEENNEQAT